MVSYADQNEASPSGEAANCEFVASFVGSWEVQWSDAIRKPKMKARRPWGLRTAKLSPLSGAPGRPSGAVSYAYLNEALPSLGAANCETVAPFVAPSSLLLCQIVVAFQA